MNLKLLGLGISMLFGFLFLKRRYTLSQVVSPILQQKNVVR